jgi:phosphoesterase RecJ-like protein
MRDIIKLIKKSKKIALFSHSNPDPDTIGSTLALYEALVSLKKDVYVYCDVENGENYAFLEYYARYNTEELEGFDLYISVDIPTNTMFGKYEEAFVNFPNTIKLDHHANGVDFSKNRLVKTYSACALVVYELLKKLKVKITPSIATSLYFGICGDTGLFRNSNTDSKTFEVCADLLQKVLKLDVFIVNFLIREMFLMLNLHQAQS